MPGEKILIVDDEAPHRQFLRSALEATGYRVAEAEDGQEGLDRADTLRPDLVLLDLDMPRLDGHAVCRRLRQEAKTRFLPIIMVTALDVLPQKLRAWEGGVDDYLNKPVLVTELLTRVRSLLRFRKSVLELESAALVLEATVRVVECRDPYTSEHSGRVGRYATRLGRALGLAADDLGTLARGAALHDLGKIGVPDAVLLKPGPLSPEEREIVRRHPVIGAELCAPLRSLAEALPLVRSHHEHLDGSGYPDGLAGDQIPLLVRILSVADVFDALTSTRRYRLAMPFDRALAVLEKETAGGWWDRDVLEALQRLLAAEAAVPSRA